MGWSVIDGGWGEDGEGKWVLIGSWTPPGNTTQNLCGVRVR